MAEFPPDTNEGVDTPLFDWVPDDPDMAEQLRSLPAEQRTPLLRQVIERASGVDKNSSQRILDELASVGMSVVSTEEFDQAKRGLESFRHITALTHELFPDN